MYSLNFSINRHSKMVANMGLLGRRIAFRRHARMFVFSSAFGIQPPDAGRYNLHFSDIREQIVDRGIERGEQEMANLNKQLKRDEPSDELQVGAVGEHNSGQMSAEASDQVGTTPMMNSQEGSGRPDVRKDDVRDRKVDPDAVRESFKEAELDPLAETEPEEGEKAA